MLVHIHNPSIWWQEGRWREAIPQKLANQLAWVQRNEQERHCVSHKVRVKTSTGGCPLTSAQVLPTEKEQGRGRDTERGRRRRKTTSLLEVLSNFFWMISSANGHPPNDSGHFIMQRQRTTRWKFYLPFDISPAHDDKTV